jgi:hypothetical protein
VILAVVLAALVIAAIAFWAWRRHRRERSPAWLIAKANVEIQMHDIENRIRVELAKEEMAENMRYVRRLFDQQMGVDRGIEAEQA